MNEWRMKGNNGFFTISFEEEVKPYSFAFLYPKVIYNKTYKK